MMLKYMLLLSILVTFSSSGQGYRVMTKNDQRVLVYSGDEVTYKQLTNSFKCKYISSSRGIDDKGLSYKADGFSCTEDLYVVFKTWLDIDIQGIVEVDPKTEKSKAFKVDFYREYQ